MQNIHTHTWSLRGRPCAYISAGVCLCAFRDRTHIHAGQNEAPWVLSEMHNREETWQLVLVKGVREVSLAFHCCGLCFWRFRNTKKKLSRLISITTEMTL